MYETLYKFYEKLIGVLYESPNPKYVKNLKSL
jgi:hypothetical protein